MLSTSNLSRPIGLGRAPGLTATSQFRAQFSSHFRHSSTLAPTVQVHNSAERLVCLSTSLVGVSVPHEPVEIRPHHPGERPEI